MRLAVLAALLLGCSSPVIVVLAPDPVGSTLIPQPDGTITMYCIPSGA